MISIWEGIMNTDTLVQRACEFAAKAHKGQMYGDGDY